MHIGELASKSGLAPTTLRYYERLGLLRPRRSSRGFRCYPPDTVDRLRFIKETQALGLILREIRDILSYQEPGGLAECRRVRDLLRVQIEGLDAKAVEIQSLRTLLEPHLHACDRALAEGHERRCPAAENLKAPAGRNSDARR